MRHTFCFSFLTFPASSDGGCTGRACWDGSDAPGRAIQLSQPLLCLLGVNIYISMHTYLHTCKGNGFVTAGGCAGLSRGAMCLCRIESYSCKMAGDDKHMFKQFCQEGQPHVLEALSPPQTTGISPSRYHGLGVVFCHAPHYRQQQCVWGWVLGFVEGRTLRWWLASFLWPWDGCSACS